MDFNNINIQQLEWNSFESKNRLKYLNLISNKNKLMDDCELNNDDFFTDFIKNQQMVVKENLSLAKTEFKAIGEHHLDVSQPSIYCSFRIGAFMSIPIFLLKKGVDLIVLSSKESYSKVMDLKKKNKAYDGIEVIKVNDPNGFRKIITESKKGKSFFCLIDVGRSVNDNQKHKAVVDFGNAQIETMIGIPYLSHVLKMPLVPLFSYRADNLNYIHIEEEIDKNAYKDRMDFGLGATHLLWEKFERYFLKYPTQWESLYYLRDFLKEDDETDIALVHEVKNESLGFNEKRYTFFIRDNEYYLFDYETCHQFNVSKYMFVFFQKINEAKTRLRLHDLKSFFKTEKIIENFIEKKILIPA